MRRHSCEGGALPEPDADLDARARAVVQAAIEVHRILGPGFLESLYEEAMCRELALRRLPFQQQVPISMSYKGQRIGEARLDLLVGGRLVVELKAVDALAPIHVAQVLSYLKATGHVLGLLINFNVSFLQQGLKRVVLTRDRQRPPTVIQ